MYVFIINTRPFTLEFYIFLLFFFWKIERKTTVNRQNAVDAAYRTAVTEKYSVLW